MPSVAATRRHDLSDVRWAALERVLPAVSGKGRPPKWTKRQIIDGIRWRVRTGTPWRDVPEAYPPWQTLYHWFRRWQRDGTWAMILAELQADADADGRIDWAVSVDSTVSGHTSTRPVPVARVTCRSSRPAGCRPSPPITGWAGPGAG